MFLKKINNGDLVTGGHTWSHFIYLAMSGCNIGCISHATSISDIFRDDDDDWPLIDLRGSAAGKKDSVSYPYHQKLCPL